MGLWKWIRGLGIEVVRDNAVKEAAEQRERLYAISRDAARAAAEGCARDPQYFTILASHESDAKLLSRLGPCARSWFERHPALVSGVYGTELSLRPGAARPGHVCIGADLEGAVYYVADGTDSVLRNEFDDTLHELAPTIFHGVLQIVWEEHGRLVGSEG